MDNVFQGPAKLSPTPTPRFTLGRAAGGGLAACLWLWTSAGALAASDPTAYQNALASFNRGDDARALTQLQHAPANGTAREQADIFNLRGAVYLRQHRYEQAQAQFSRASRMDRSLWAARFNEAEVSFRQQHYAESRRQFAALLDDTSRLFHSEEHKFVRYKLLLAGICAGDEKPALAFIADHRDDERPPLGWYYLNAALARRHGAPSQTDQWLAQANSRSAGGSGQTYAESFDRLGWGSEAPQRVPRGVAEPDRLVAKAGSSRSRSTDLPETAGSNFAGSGSPSKTLAVVEVLPERVPGGGRSSASPATPAELSDAISSLNAPPTPDESLAAFEANVRAVRDAEVPLPAVVARPRRSRGTPAPSPSPSAPPDAASGVTANQGGPTPTPTITPSGTPSDEFAAKYEEAYAKFLEKNYPDSLLVLDEADKVQPGQPQTTSLRFKCHYALAYLEYRKQNYPGALGELDKADQTQKNADSFNLRGLIFSKQHNYDQAETMFHRAITTDPALWAAKFNYAELPFNRGNYTDARTRFEELFSQTDDKKQPREAELTQYKVFLTLLLEGKVEAASTFMDHLNFSGATPARYFCNAALNFRAGSVDKAKNWIDDARKEYPPQLVAIFIESFYRLGWMADPNVQPGTAIVQATPAPTPAVTTSGTQPTTVATATATPTPASSAAAVAAASPTATPIVVAAASPPPTPLAVAPSPSATVRPAASPSPAIVAVTPVPGLTRPAVVLTSPTPAPTASVPAVVAATPSASPVRPAVSGSPVIAAVPSASPARTVASATASPVPRPSATAPAVVLVPTPAVSPARSVAAATATPTPVTARATPTPTVAPAVETISTSTAQAQKKKHRRIFILAIALFEILYFVTKMRSVLKRREQNRRRAAARKRGMVESSK